MKRIVLGHIAGFAVVLAVLLAILALVHDRRAAAAAEAGRLLQPFLQLDSLDLGDPEQSALLLESFRTFHPGSSTQTEALAAAIDAYRRDRYGARHLHRSLEGRGLAAGEVMRLLRMFLQFAVVVVVVLFLTYHGGRIAAIRRFVREQQGIPTAAGQIVSLVRSGDVRRDPLRVARKGGLLALRWAGACVGSLILFTPAYVIAYAFKSVVDVASVPSMFVLAVVSNGLLVSVATTFHTLLVHEARRGYVETAVVKGLESDYRWPDRWDERLRAVVFPLEAFPRHVFRHIYMNARHQYIPVLKQHAAFLVTGLVIIEMALNIQGHLCYELLQRILYNDADGVVFIVLCIFALVKGTELTVDAWGHREARRYGLVGTR